MKSYIDLNMNLRKNAKSKFDKDLWKLMNNSVFGKTMENLRNRVNVDLVRFGSEEKKIRKLLASPNFAGVNFVYYNLGLFTRTSQQSY